MVLPVNTDSLKTLSNMLIECKHAEQLGIQVFNNLNNVSQEYAEICYAFKESCEKIYADVEKLKTLIPHI